MKPCIRLQGTMMRRGTGVWEWVLIVVKVQYRDIGLDFQCFRVWPRLSSASATAEPALLRCTDLSVTALRRVKVLVLRHLRCLGLFVTCFVQYRPHTLHVGGANTRRTAGTAHSCGRRLCALQLLCRGWLDERPSKADWRQYILRIEYQ